MLFLTGAQVEPGADRDGLVLRAMMISSSTPHLLPNRCRWEAHLRTKELSGTSPAHTCMPCQVGSGGSCFPGGGQSAPCGLGLVPGPGWVLTAAPPSDLSGSAPQRTVPSGVSSWTCFRTGWLISENLPPRPAQPTPRSWWRLTSSAEILTLTTAPQVRWWASPIGLAAGEGMGSRHSGKGSG